MDRYGTARKQGRFSQKVTGRQWFLRGLAGIGLGRPNSRREILMAFVALHHPSAGRNPSRRPWGESSAEERVNALFPRPVCTVWNPAHLLKSVSLLLDFSQAAKQCGNRGTLFVRSEAQHNFEVHNYDFHRR